MPRDPERKKEYDREYREKNRDRLREKKREYVERNRDRVREYQKTYLKEYREKNRDRIREKKRENYERNGDRIRAEVSEYQKQNRGKIRDRRRSNYAQLSSDERRAIKLKSKHGMRPDQWNALYEQQDGRCYLCLQPLSDDLTEIDIDHDHRCCGPKRSCALCRRGLACHGCNTGAGFFGDSPERMRIAADNLERAQAAVTALMTSASYQEPLF